MVHIGKKLQEKHQDGKPTFSFEYFVPKTAQVCLPHCSFIVNSIANPKARVCKISMIVCHGYTILKRGSIAY